MSTRDWALSYAAAPLSLFDVSEPRARRSDPSTSKDAAVRVAPVAAKLPPRILECLQFRAMTADSICKTLDVDVRYWPTVKSCLSRMKKDGRLAWTGEQINGQNVWTRPENATPLRLVPNADYL